MVVLGIFLIFSDSLTLDLTDQPPSVWTYKLTGYLSSNLF